MPVNTEQVEGDKFLWKYWPKLITEDALSAIPLLCAVVFKPSMKDVYEI
jgi:hypothetical protein